MHHRFGVAGIPALLPLHGHRRENGRPHSCPAAADASAARHSLPFPPHPPPAAAAAAAAAGAADKEYLAP